MKKLWNWIDGHIYGNIQKKRMVFLCLHTVLWAAIPFFLCCICGLFVGFSGKWLEYTVIAMGYPAIYVGFFGGALLFTDSDNLKE